MMKKYVGTRVATGGYACRCFVDLEQFWKTYEDELIGYIEGQKTARRKMLAVEKWLENEIWSYEGVWEESINSYWMEMQYEEFCQAMRKRKGVILRVA